MNRSFGVFAFLAAVVFVSPGLPLSSKVQASQSEALQAACADPLIEGSIRGEHTFVRARPASRIRQELNGFIDGRSTRITLERLNGSTTRLQGWLGSEPVSLKIQDRGNGETRIAGRFGGGEPISVTIEAVPARGQVQVHGFGRYGFIHMTFFRGREEHLNGSIDRVMLSSELRRSPGSIWMRGTLGTEFVDLTASECLTGYLPLRHLTSGEAMLVLAMLAV